MARLAIFDCDGTLVDGQANICEAMEEACQAADLPVPPRVKIRRIIGLSLPQALFYLAPDASEGQRALAVDTYKQAFRKSRSEGRLSEPLFAGMADLLADLKQAGWLLGVATGKSDRGLRSCLDQHRIATLFTTLQAADYHPSKPHPAMIEAAMEEAGVGPQDTVMIGDTSFDMTMAHNAEVRAIGVAWGYHDAAELLEEGADIVAETIDELRGIMIA